MGCGASSPSSKARANLSSSSGVTDPSPRPKEAEHPTHTDDTKKDNNNETAEGDTIEEYKRTITTTSTLSPLAPNSSPPLGPKPSKKPISLDDDSPPSSPGHQTTNITSTATEQKTNDHFLSPNKSALNTSAINPFTPSNASTKSNGATPTHTNPNTNTKKRSSNDDEEEDAETAALRQHILSQTEDLDEEIQKKKNKKEKEREKEKEKEKEREKDKDHKSSKHKDKDSRRKKDKDDKNDGTKSSSTKSSSKRRDSTHSTNSADRHSNLSARHSAEEKQNDHTPRKEKKSSSDKRQSSSSSRPSHYTQEGVSTKYDKHPSDSTYFHNPSPLHPNVWAMDSHQPGPAIPLIPSGGTFTSWNSTAKGARQNVSNPSPPSPVGPQPSTVTIDATPLPLPNFQVGFDPEKFRRAQIDLAAKKESYQHASHDLHHNYDTLSISQRTIVAHEKKVESTDRSRATDKKLLSHEDEAMIDELLMEDS